MSTVFLGIYDCSDMEFFTIHDVPPGPAIMAACLSAVAASLVRFLSASEKKKPSVRQGIERASAGTYLLPSPARSPQQSPRSRTVPGSDGKEESNDIMSLVRLLFSEGTGPHVR